MSKSKLLLILLAIMFVVKVSLPKNVSGETFHGHRYAIIEDPGITWFEARDICEQYDGHLVTVTSEEENDFLISTFRESIMAKWMGGYQPNPITEEEPNEGWEWITGEEWDYTHWRLNVPNNKNGIEHYLGFKGFGKGGKLGDWQDFSYFHSLTGYVIEWDAPTECSCD